MDNTSGLLSRRSRILERGRNQFVGWKEGEKEWEASDSYASLVEVDNRNGTSDIKAEFERRRGTSLAQESTRAGSFSTSLSASASFGSIFQASVSTSISFD